MTTAATIAITKVLPVWCSGQEFGKVRARYEGLVSDGRIVRAWMTPASASETDEWVAVPIETFLARPGDDANPFVLAVRDGARLLSTIREMERLAVAQAVRSVPGPFRGPAVVAG